MGHVQVREVDVDLDEPTLIEGLPGLGLVGKLATDHVVDLFDMTYYGSLHCPGLPRVAAYRGGDRTVRPPVRLYADGERDLLALQSDVPVSPGSVTDFASCVSGWLAEVDATPIYFTGLGTEVEMDGTGDRSVYGVATGGGTAILDDVGVPPPEEDGVWSGPTGALLDAARSDGLTALGVIVDSDPNFPDPEAAAVLVEAVVEPVADVEISAASLREHAEEIRDQKQAFAHQMNATEGDESSRADPMGMYQ